MKKLIFSIITIAIAGGVVVAPAFADEYNCTLTSIITNAVCDKNGNYKDDEGQPESDESYCYCTKISGDNANDNANSIVGIIGIVVNILSVGVGILGVLGITITGIQYLTAGGSEEKTRKAKRRMFEIILGLVAYVLLYAFLQWLLPNFNGLN